MFRDLRPTALPMVGIAQYLKSKMVGGAVHGDLAPLPRLPRLPRSSSAMPSLASKRGRLAKLSYLVNAMDGHAPPPPPKALGSTKRWDTLAWFSIARCCTDTYLDDAWLACFSVVATTCLNYAWVLTLLPCFSRKPLILTMLACVANYQDGKLATTCMNFTTSSQSGGGMRCKYCPGCLAVRNQRCILAGTHISLRSAPGWSTGGCFTVGNRKSYIALVGCVHSSAHRLFSCGLWISSPSPKRSRIFSLTSA